MNDEYREANMATIRLSGVYFPGVEFLAGIGTAIILYFGSTQVLDQDMSVGVMVAFVGYLSSFFDPIQQLSQLYNTFQSAMAALEKIFGVLDTEPELADPPDCAPLPPIAGAVELRDVSFGYAREYVVHDVNLRIAPGETVALVGSTGAGKSTLAKLIARFYDPDEGSVLIDGHDLREVSIRSLRDQLAIVPAGGAPVRGHDRREPGLRAPRGDRRGARTPPPRRSARPSSSRPSRRATTPASTSAARASRPASASSCRSRERWSPIPAC